MNKRITTQLILAIAITLVVVALPYVTLGVISAKPDGTSFVEWAWARHATFSDIADFLDRTFWPFFAAGCLVLVARFGLQRIQYAPRKSTALAFVLLLIAAAHWMVAIQQSAASPHKELKPLWVLYDPAASGYFYEAAFDIHDTKEFLSTYEARMAEGDVLHVGTHPPGMFLLAKACIETCRCYPTVQSLADALTFDSTIEAFQYIEQNARLNRSLTSSEIAGLKLLSLLTLTMSVLTLLPLCMIAKRMFVPSTAWIVCCLWPTIPAISVFYPKSDVIFPSLSLLLILLAMIGAESAKKAAIIGVVAGAVLMLSSCLSLAILPTVAAIGIFLICQTLKAPRRNGVPAATLTASVTVTCALLVVAIQAAFDCNLINVFQHNLTNHSGFYQQFQRTYWKWLLVNPMELAFAVGLPVMALAVASFPALFSRRRQDPVDKDQHATLNRVEHSDDTVRSLSIALIVTILLLWLSGKNNGEAARLWCFMTPWLLLLAGNCLQRIATSHTPTQVSTQFKWLLVTQLLLSLITVARVNGFSF
ncbi:MAG: hypothetical protein ABJZ55_06510 [Fuerstiella sp.]